MSHSQLIIPLIRRAIIIAFFLTLWLSASTMFGQTQQSNDARELPPDQTIEREMTGAETHRYKFDLKVNESFQVRVEQKGVDVALKLSDSTETVLATMDSPNGKDGPEVLSFVSAKSGSYTLAIISLDKKAEKGTYSLNREESRTATDTDKVRVRTERLFVEAIAEMGAKDSSARSKVIAKLQEVQKGWEELNDRYRADLTILQIERLHRAQRIAMIDMKETEAMRIARPLPLGEKLNRAIADGEFHAYSIVLSAGSVVRIKLQEKGSNVSIALGMKSLKEPLLPAQSFGETDGREMATLIAPKTGEYILIVTTVSGLYMPGSYELIGEVSEVATEVDQQKVDAQRLFREAFSSLRDVKQVNKRDAAIKFEAALLVWKKLNEAYMTAYACNRLGLLYLDLKEFRKAEECFEQAAALWKNEGCHTGYGNALNNMALVYSALGDKQKALEFTQLALPEFKMVNAILALGNSLANMGDIYSDQSDYQKALTYYEEALPLLKTTGYKIGEARTLGGIAYVNSNLGNEEAALVNANQSLSLFRQIGNRSGEATALSRLGKVYFEIGQKQKALESLQKSLLIRKEIGERPGESASLRMIGTAYFSMNEPRKAIDYYEQSLRVLKEHGGEGHQGLILVGIGDAYTSLGDSQLALDYYNQALALFRKRGESRLVAYSLSSIGKANFELGRPNNIIENYRQALPVFRATGDKSAEAESLRYCLLFYRSQRNPRAAIFFGKLAVNILQRLRRNVHKLTSDDQKSYLSNFKESYQQVAELLIDEGQSSQAVQVLKLYQDQQFFDLNKGPNLPIQQLSLSLREEEFANRFEVAIGNLGQVLMQVDNLKSLQIGSRKPTEVETAQLQELESILKAASDKFAAFFKDAEMEFAKQVDKKDLIGELHDVSDMQGALRQLSTENKRAVALYTLIGEETFHTLLITPDGKVKNFRSPIKAGELNKKILQFYGLLQTPHYDPRPLGKELYDIIVKPIEAELRKQKSQTLMWQLDGSLRYVPVAALFDGEKYLVEKYQNVVFTRADKLGMTKSVNPNWTGTAFGSSQAQRIDLLGDGDKIAFAALPGVNEELQSIFRHDSNDAGIIKGEVFSDNQFTRTTFFDSLKQHRPLVHISSHFAFRPGDDSRSFLLLGDGFLTLNEIKRHDDLFQGVDLLTLSACNTAATQADANGREIDGFAELAQRLGAKSVLASLWSVSDPSTRDFMVKFYELFIRRTITKADALRQAQLALLNRTTKAGTKPRRVDNDAKDVTEPKLPAAAAGPYGKSKSGGRRDTNDIDPGFGMNAPPYYKDPAKPYAHPYFWAPFVLFGNWR